MKKVDTILSELDRWIVGKGDGNYIEYDYNPYTSFETHTSVSYTHLRAHET